MRLDIVGKPELSITGVQSIHVNYDPLLQTTSVICHADVMTVKIAIEILTEKYTEAIKDLDHIQVQDIEQTVKEAINNGQNRGKSIESGRYYGCRENDGCDGKTDATGPQNQGYGKLLSLNRCPV